MTNNKMMVKGETVVLAGKVRGFLYSTTLTDGTVYRRFVPKWSKQEHIMTEESTTMTTRAVEPHEVPRDVRKAAMKGEQTELVRLLEKAPTREPIDSPFIKMVQENKVRQDKAKKERARKDAFKAEVLDFFELR